MATVSTEIDFDIQASYSAQEFTLTDASTYSATDLTWTSANSRGLIKVVDPLGNTIYNNTDTANPDLTVGLGTVSGIKYAADGDGNLITGNYQVTLTLFDQGVPATQFERTFTMKVDFAAPTTVLDISWSVINPIYFKSVDNTTYDQLNYAYTITRTQTLFYPNVIGGSESQSGITFNSNTFYTGSSTMRLLADVDYTFLGFFNDVPNTDVAFTFNYTNTTDEVVFVDDTNSVCQMYCCVDNAWEKYQSARTGMKSNTGTLKAVWQEAADNWFMMKQSFECNQSQNVAKYRAEIQRVTNCSGDGCECSSTTPTQVIGVGTTTELTKKITFVTAAPTASYTNTELKGLSWADGDFIVFVDGEEQESLVLSNSFNSATGEFIFGYTIPSGVEVYFQIVKR